MPKRLLLALPWPNEDEATVYVDIQIYVTEEVPVVPLDLQASGVESKESVDAATVYLNLVNTGNECYTTFSATYLGEGEATLNWSGAAVLRWSSEANLQWSPGEPQVDGETC